MAKRSRNDGTNVFASKETLGDLAGVSERTAFRIIDELVEARAVVKAESHQCSVKTCPKGSRHYPAPGNHWTQAYNINVEGLEEAAAKLRDFSEHRGESRKPRAARKTEWHDILSLQPYGEWYDILSVNGVTFCQQSRMPFWQANLGLQDNPVPLGSKDSSALTSGVRERVSSPPSPAPASPEDRGGHPRTPVVLGLGTEEAKQDQKQSQPQPQNQELEERFYTEDVVTDEGYLLGEIMPKPSAAAIEKGLPLCRRILAHFDDADDYAGVAAGLVLKYNRAHRGQKYATKDDRAMYIRMPEQYLKALESENATLMNDYLTHDFEKCELCVEAVVGNYHKLIREIRKDKRQKEKKREQQREEQKRGEDEQARPSKPPKFDTTTATPEVTKALAAWFKDNGKDGDWMPTNKEERKALGVNDQHVTGVLRYLHKNQEKVTREQFVALLRECAAQKPIVAPDHHRDKL